MQSAGGNITYSTYIYYVHLYKTNAAEHQSLDTTVSSGTSTLFVKVIMMLKLEEKNLCIRPALGVLFRMLNPMQ